MAVDRHTLGDFAPYVFKTTDFGKSWKALVNGLPANDYVNAVRVDPKHAGLLFPGTERGGTVSFDDGEHWQSLQLNLPVSPVNDLVVKNNDLVLATHGRSFWVLDDITPLEQYSDAVTQEAAHLFAPAPANHTLFRGSFFGGGANTGKNPPAGAVIDYWLKTALKKLDADKKDSDKKDAEKKDSSDSGAKTPGTDAKSEASAKAETKDEAPKITLDIVDASGKVIRHFP